MSGLRRLLRFLDHKLHAWMEPIVYRRSECVVVPSWGLARELAEEYPWLEQRIAVISNPVSLHRWIKPSGFDPKLFRRAKGLGEDSFVLAFVALGQFERKGLPLLIEALALQDDRQLELLVVGGDDGALEPYRDRCRAIGLADRVHFTGMRRDIRPYLWAADAFVLPSSYEVFPLVCLQAAAASLPLLASHLHGVEEFLTDGCNGILVERTVTGIHSGIAAARELAPEDLRWMGKQARCDVERFGERPFSAAWSELYASFSPEPPAAMTQGA
jgi:glycosyltransferase involved in cell wall biosynthesis